MPFAATKVIRFSFDISIARDSDLSLVGGVVNGCFPKNQLVVVLLVFFLAITGFAVAKECRQRIMDGTIVMEALLLGGISCPFRASQRNALEVVFFADVLNPIKTVNLALCHHNAANRTLFPYRPLLAESLQADQLVLLFRRGIGIPLDSGAICDDNFGCVLDGSEFGFLVPQLLAVFFR